MILDGPILFPPCSGYRVLAFMNRSSRLRRSWKKLLGLISSAEAEQTN
jgi:hypothetical protein